MGEQGVQEGLSTPPCGTPVLRISGVVEVLMLTFTTWVQPVRMSRTQLHSAGFRPRPPSLVMSLEGAMVLKAELSVLVRVLHRGCLSLYNP
jgi:hypothetical protein